MLDNYKVNYVFLQYQCQSTGSKEKKEIKNKEIFCSNAQLVAKFEEQRKRVLIPFIENNQTKQIN